MMHPAHDAEEVPSGTPWLDQPVMLHSSRADECTLTAEQCVYRRGHWRYWYEADHVYALNTTYFLCATVAVFAIIHFAARYAPAWARKNPVWRRSTAAGRFLAYRGVRFPVLGVPALGYSYASLGVVLLISVGVVFFSAMTLGPRPYYWPNTATVSFGGSPPIATRSGWIAIALLPFVLALSVKANLISAITGVPHEKLQVFHHWTSYAMFVLALVHTFPFIVYNISIGNMESEWDTSVFYWTGVVALLAQTYLTFMSLSPIRNRYYEFFKPTHFLIALVFILFLFFHCDFRLTSWDYIIAAVTIYTACLLFAFLRTHLINHFQRKSATLTLLPSNALLQIKLPTVMTWKPGQHVFLRFVPSRKLGLLQGLHVLTSHPFTISSSSQNSRETRNANEMVFYVKPRDGITGRLAHIAAQHPGMAHTVFVEGPYGGIDTGILSRFESVAIITGGSGGGFSLPVFEEALRVYKKTEARREGGEQGYGAIRVVFATRSRAIARWYRRETWVLRERYGLEGNADISVSIHLTSNDGDKRSFTGGVDPEKTAIATTTTTTATSDVRALPTSTSSLSISRPLEKDHSDKSENDEGEEDPSTFQTGRPNIPGIIATTTESAKRTAIFACGPSSMLDDVRSAAANEQSRILRGSSKGEEVYLHSETFS
ncbi:ferric reductase like transmembrane component-domain-containing protein [Aspergillus lucknowensis]|uniref:ferric-chelate reductase (NADPH) n=1 Tax=Aspergillus lucknowensis TaxID=176173 RepID=A0ABR4LQR2_9EURO